MRPFHESQVYNGVGTLGLYQLFNIDQSNNNNNNMRLFIVSTTTPRRKRLTLSSSDSVGCLFRGDRGSLARRRRRRIRRRPARRRRRIWRVRSSFSGIDHRAQPWNRNRTPLRRRWRRWRRRRRRRRTWVERRRTWVGRRRWRRRRRRRRRWWRPTLRNRFWRISFQHSRGCAPRRSDPSKSEWFAVFFL